jgi:hypothetical protein
MELLGWTRQEVLAGLRTGILAGVQNPKRKRQWSIVHPGLRFVEYERNHDTRLRHIAILSIEDIAAITGLRLQKIEDCIARRHIQPLVFPGKQRSPRNSYYRTLFTPWQVRGLLRDILNREVWLRPPITADILKKFFERSMIDKVATDPYERVKQEIEWIFWHPEPERSIKLHELMRQVDELAKQQEAQSGVR